MNRMIITPARGSRWLCLVLLSMSLFTITIDLTILNVALPKMAEDLQPSATEQLWMVDSYSLVMAGLLVSMSALGDRFGRRTVLLAGALVVILASFGVLIADTPVHIILVRVLHGVGSAMMMPSTLSLIRVVFPDPRERATALGIWAAISSAGAAIGPLIGGLLLEAFSWHSAFLVAIPLMVVTFIGGLIYLPEARLEEPPSWDWLAAGLSLVGMTAFLWSIKQFAEHTTLADPAAWIVGLLGITALAWFVQRCRHRPQPLFDISMFRYPIFTAGVLCALTGNLASQGVLYLSTQWLQLVHGVTPLHAGMVMLPAALAGVVMSLAISWITARTGLRLANLLSLVMIGIGLAMIGIVGRHLNITALVIALLIVGAGFGGMAIASSMIMGGAPASKAGSAAAMEDTSYELGAVLGIALLGSLATLIYRHSLAGAEALATWPADIAHRVRESLTSAVGVVEELGGAVGDGTSAGISESGVSAGSSGAQGLDPHQLADAAMIAFSDAFAWTALVAAVLVVVLAIGIFKLIPRGTRLEDLNE